MRLSETAGRRRRRPALARIRRLVVAGLAAAIIGYGLLFPLHILKIEALRERRTVHARLVRPDDRLALGFIHSVEHCPVRDHFTIDGAYRLVLRETTFASSNTGLPYRCGPGETFANEGTQFRIGNRRIFLQEIDLWVNEKYGNFIRFKGEEELQLSGLAGNTLLRVSVVKAAAARYLFWKAGFPLP